MNIIEKRKSQLTTIAIVMLALCAILTIVGIALTISACSGNSVNTVKVVIGIILLVLGGVGVLFGVALLWISSAVKATHGSIAEENLGKGTVNMNKCENCGAEVEPGVKLCSQCEENLKP